MTGIWFVIIMTSLWAGSAIVFTQRNTRNLRFVAVIASVIAAIATSLLVPLSSTNSITGLYLGDAFGALSFRVDTMGATLAVIAAVIGCITVIYSLDYMVTNPQQHRYFALVLLFIGAMIGLVLTDSLLMLFFFWELTEFCSYALIAFDSDNPAAATGGIRALLITQIGGLGLLLAALTIYSYTGSYAISTLVANPGLLPDHTLSLVAFGMLAAAAAKSAQFPFHTWLPGAMEAPTPVSALIHAATMVNAGVYLLARFYPAFADVNGWSSAVIAVGVVSAVGAAFLALTATDLKGVLAYSTISQLGYMVYAVGLGDIVASQFHLMSHAIFKALLFLAAGAVIHSAGTRDLSRLRGAGRSMPVTRGVFIVGGLALAGIPIMNGFWSKELILEAGYLHGPVWASGLMLLGVGLTALYTVRVVAVVFFGEAQTGILPAGWMMRLSMGVLAAGVVLSWLLIEPLTAQLAETLPAHDIHVVSLRTLVDDITKAPVTPIALLITGFGAALWMLRGTMAAILTQMDGLKPVMQGDFGFTAVNRHLSGIVTLTGVRLSRLHTGLVNWNIAAAAIGLLVVLVWCIGRAQL